MRTTGKERRATCEAPLISVVTVVYNGEEHLEQAIRSVIDQGYDNVEYIVIDGGSTDGTADIFKRHEDRIDYWVSEPDRGIYDAMNKGIALARGDLIGLLNADDYYEPGALETVAQAYRAAPCEGIYYGNNYVLQEDLGLRYRSYASLRSWLGMPICHQAMFVHRAVYERLGGYSLDYRYAADYEFLLRSMRLKVPYVPVAAFVVDYRNTGLTSANYTASLREAKAINRAYFRTCSLRHAEFLAAYGKTIVLYLAQQALKTLFGERILNRFRLWYMKAFIAKEREELG